MAVLAGSMTDAAAAARAETREPGVLRIYLARHGQTDWNAEHRLQGWTDRHLDSLGRAQAARTALRLAGVHFDHVYCSRLSRSRETAMILHGDAPIDSLEGLNEQKLGKFEGVVIVGGDSATIAEYRRRTALPDDVLDTGESLNQHYARVRVALDEIRKRHSSGNILIVGHGGTNKQILHVLLGLTLEQMAEINQSNDEVYLIELEEGSTPRLWKLIPETSLKEL
jgi:broad specificity phosphatase PhoE